MLYKFLINLILLFYSFLFIIDKFLISKYKKFISDDTVIDIMRLKLISERKPPKHVL